MPVTAETALCRRWQSCSGLMLLPCRSCLCSKYKVRKANLNVTGGTAGIVDFVICRQAKNVGSTLGEPRVDNLSDGQSGHLVPGHHFSGTRFDGQAGDLCKACRQWKCPDWCTWCRLAFSTMCIMGEASVDAVTRDGMPCSVALSRKSASTYSVQHQFDPHPRCKPL